MAHSDDMLQSLPPIIDTKEVDVKAVNTKDIDTKDIDTKDIDTKDIDVKAKAHNDSLFTDSLLVLDDIRYTYPLSDDNTKQRGGTHKSGTKAGQALPIFEHLNLDVQKSDVVSIVGASGVGKTTLFNIVAGLLIPDAGGVWIERRNTTGQAGHVGYMLQKDLLLPFKTVYDNICLPLTLKGWSKQQIAEKVRPQLRAFGLEGLGDKYPRTLSGGQRQRAALLRSYLSDHPLMLLDEPFSALDFVTKNEMYHWFKQLQQSFSLTCLIITHDIEEALFLSDRIVVLKGAPAHFSEVFTVPSDKDFLDSQAYLQLKKRILAAIQ